MAAGGALSTASRKISGVLRPHRRRRLLARMPRGARCAEIGVWKGDFSHLIREVTRPQQLHLIDPWEFQQEFPERMYGGKVARSQADMDRIYEGVRRRFRRFPEVVLHRGRSAEVLAEFGDGYFDWLYIDGNHYYEYVRADLERAYAKVAQGGFIVGDDYTWGVREGYPVKRAVQDFLAAHDLRDRFERIGSQYLIGR